MSSIVESALIAGIQGTMSAKTGLDDFGHRGWACLAPGNGLRLPGDQWKLFSYPTTSL